MTDPRILQFARIRAARRAVREAGLEHEPGPVQFMVEEPFLDGLCDDLVTDEDKKWGEEEAERRGVQRTHGDRWPEREAKFLEKGV